MKLFTDLVKRCKWRIIPYVVCTVWFLYSPYLHLSKTDTAYYEYAIQFGSCPPLTEWMLDDLKFFYVMRAYLLLLAIITLLFFMIKTFHGKTTAIAVACAGVFLHVVAYYYTELYPSIGAVYLVWSNDGISQNDPAGILRRYHYFLTWLEGWLIVLAVITVFLYLYHRSKKE